MLLGISPEYFLQAHVIPNKHWLQHILHRVVVNPKILAMPVLDQIPQENWEIYYPMPPGHWRYEWNFNLVYTSLGSQQELSRLQLFFPFLGDAGRRLVSDVRPALLSEHGRPAGHSTQAAANCSTGLSGCKKREKLFCDDLFR